MSSNEQKTFRIHIGSFEGNPSNQTTGTIEFNRIYHNTSTGTTEILDNYTVGKSWETSTETILYHSSESSVTGYITKEDLVTNKGNVLPASETKSWYFPNGWHMYGNGSGGYFYIKDENNNIIESGYATTSANVDYMMLFAVVNNGRVEQARCGLFSNGKCVKLTPVINNYFLFNLAWEDADTDPDSPQPKPPSGTTKTKTSKYIPTPTGNFIITTIPSDKLPTPSQVAATQHPEDVTDCWIPFKNEDGETLTYLTTNEQSGDADRIREMAGYFYNTYTTHIGSDFTRLKNGKYTNGIDLVTTEVRSPGEFYIDAKNMRFKILAPGTASYIVLQTKNSDDTYTDVQYVNIKRNWGNLFRSGYAQIYNYYIGYNSSFNQYYIACSYRWSGNPDTPSYTPYVAHYYVVAYFTPEASKIINDETTTTSAGGEGSNIGGPGAGEPGSGFDPESSGGDDSTGTRGNGEGSEPSGGPGDPNDEPGGPNDPGEPDPPSETALNCGFIKTYKISLGQCRQLASWMNSENIWDWVKEYFTGSPLDVIVSLHKIPALVTQLGAAEPITFGTHTSPFSFRPVSDNAQFIKMYEGTLNLPEQFTNHEFLNYSPHTTVSIHLPFIGVQPLEVDDCMGRTLKVEYYIDILTGSLTANLYTYYNGYYHMRYNWSGECIMKFPMTNTDHNNIIAQLMRAPTMAAATGLSVASGNYLGAVTSLMGFGSGMASSIKPNYQHSNGLNGTAGWCDIRRPYLIITMPEVYIPPTYALTEGIPTNDAVYIGSLKNSGYTVMESVNLAGLNCTKNEEDMIKSALLKGVYL